MPLELSFMEEEDIPEFADIDDAAMAGSRLAKAMENSDSARGSRKGLILEYVRKGFHADSRQAYLKVTDTDTGEMVAVALWRFVLEPEEKNPEEAPAASEEVVEKAKEDPEVPKELGVPEGLGRPSVLATMLRQWEEFVDECFPSEPYANLQILSTHPKHQRRGAGSMLLKWGCDKADERGLISVLHASQAGFGLYLKHGFEVRKVREFDLQPYGVDEIEIRRGMVRRPKPKHS